MRRTSIRFRLLTIMIFITTIPIIAVTFFATNNTRNSVMKELISANNSRLQWVDQYFDVLCEQLDKMFYTLQLNNTLMNSFRGFNSSNTTIQLKTQGYASDTISNCLFANSRNVENLTLYMNSIKKAFSVDFQNTGTLYPLDISKGNWSRMSREPAALYFRKSHRGICVFHSINDFYTHALLGGVSARINKNIWREVNVILKAEEDKSVFVINDEGAIISGSSKLMKLADVKHQIKSIDMNSNNIELRKTKEYLYFMKRMVDSQLIVVKLVPVSIISKSARPTIGAAILTATVAAFVAVLASIFVSLRISRPIVSLAKIMKNAQIHEFKEKPIQYTDEIGFLERCYNSMMQRIKDLIEVEYKQDIELKNAQIRTLQAQINPHFLNNTLNLIGGMALSKSVSEIYDITRGMGELMRYAISIEEDMVSIGDELKHVQNYMFIQSNRFNGRLNIIVKVDEVVKDNKIPKFTIQPIVENAFEHGLQQKEGQWELELRIKKLKNVIAILVKDNGNGINEDRLCFIRDRLSKEALSLQNGGVDNNEKQGKGIGLKNINSRLKLQFGSRYGIRIYSKLEIGTLIAIKLPIIEKGDEENI